MKNIVKELTTIVRGAVCWVLGFFWALYIVIQCKFNMEEIEAGLDQEEILARREAWEAKQRGE
jgi:hypothetical protein